MAAPSDLPLAVRKGIRDVEPKIKEAIAEIESEFGITGVTFECAWPEVYAQLPSARQSNMAQVVVEAYVSKWLPNTRRNKLLADPLVKAAILNTWTTKKLLFRINAQAKGYVHVLFENGVLVIQCASGKFYSNIDECGRTVPEGASTGSQLPLDLERNFAKFEGERAANIAKIEAALGISGVVFEIQNPLEVAAAAKARGYENRLGEVAFSWYLGRLAGNIQRIAKDDMVKEAIVEAMSAKKIVLRLNPSCTKWHAESFENGTLVIETTAEKLASNVDTTGSELESIL